MLARQHVWWPTLERDIEVSAANCSNCAKVNFKPFFSETALWPAAKFPFERVHIDYFQCNKTLFFLSSDSYSKWCHVSVLTNGTAEAVIEQLLSIFSQWGYPTKLVSDN